LQARPYASQLSEVYKGDLSHLERKLLARIVIDLYNLQPALAGLEFFKLYFRPWIKSDRVESELSVYVLRNKFTVHRIAVDGTSRDILGRE